MNADDADENGKPPEAIAVHRKPPNLKYFTFFITVIPFSRESIPVLAAKAKGRECCCSATRFSPAERQKGTSISHRTKLDAALPSHSLKLESLSPTA
jgi:hypothetical protein